MTQPAAAYPPTPTTAHRLTFLVYGTPAPQGSKVRLAHGAMVEQNKHAVQTWREDVKLAALRAMDDTPDWTRDYRQVAAHVVFTLPRPKAHYRSGKSEHLLRPDAPALHSSKPDLDKLLRSTCDALTTAGAYADDSRIAQVYAVKVYAAAVDGSPVGTLDRPGARISLQGLR